MQNLIENIYIKTKSRSVKNKKKEEARYTITKNQCYKIIHFIPLKTGK